MFINCLFIQNFITCVMMFLYTDQNVLRFEISMQVTKLMNRHEATRDLSRIARRRSHCMLVLLGVAILALAGSRVGGRIDDLVEGIVAHLHDKQGVCVPVGMGDSCAVITYYIG